MTQLSRPSRLRFPLLALSILALLVALWYGTVRLGWQIALRRPGMLAAHGPLMIAGFLGTLISIERAVAMRQRTAYAPALFSGLGALAILAGLPPLVGRALILLGSLGLMVIFVLIARQHPALHNATMLAGAAAWLIGNGLWIAGFAVYQVVLWWAGFLILTIAGERLELSRVRRLTPLSQRMFLAAAAIYVIGAALVIVLPDVGTRLTGIGTLALGVWLLRFDIAGRTVRQTGLTRFIAVCLLLGYGWLVIGGTLMAALGDQSSGLWYDAMLHAIFLGFVFAVIFGHAPLVFPAVLGLNFDYHPRFYAHLILLQLSLVGRLTGDLLRWTPARLWGGLFNGVALLLFLASTLLALRGVSAKERS